MRDLPMLNKPGSLSHLQDHASDKGAHILQAFLSYSLSWEVRTPCADSIQTGSCLLLAKAGRGHALGQHGVYIDAKTQNNDVVFWNIIYQEVCECHPQSYTCPPSLS